MIRLVKEQIVKKFYTIKSRMMGVVDLPIISHFYGIVVRMYFNDDEQHHTPHFHVKYGEHEASFDFDGSLLAGKFPKKQTKYVVAWSDIHRDELSALWDVMQTDEQYFKIKGLE